MASSGAALASSVAPHAGATGRAIGRASASALLGPSRPPLDQRWLRRTARRQLRLHPAGPTPSAGKTSAINDQQLWRERVTYQDQLAPSRLLFHLRRREPNREWRGSAATARGTLSRSAHWISLAPERPGRAGRRSSSAAPPRGSGLTENMSRDCVASDSAFVIFALTLPRGPPPSQRGQAARGPQGPPASRSVSVGGRAVPAIWKTVAEHGGSLKRSIRCPPAVSCAISGEDRIRGMAAAALKAAAAPAAATAVRAPAGER